MAKMTDEQKKEMAKLKAIPNDALKDAIINLNAFLVTKEMPELEKAPNKTDAVASFTESIGGLMDADLAGEIPEDVATFFNDYIVGSDETEAEDKPVDKKAEKAAEKAAKKAEKAANKKPGIVQHIIEAYIDGNCETKKDIIAYVEKKYKVSCSGSTISNVTCVLRHVKHRIK